MENKGLEAARAYAFLLLKYRPRSVKELRERLARKHFPAEIAEQVISALREKGFLDDAAFSRAWIASRKGQRLGAARIRSELRLKGIEPGLINEGLAAAEERCPEEETVRGIAEEKLRKLKDLDPQTARRRVYAYLIRRGFSPDTVIDTINGLT